MNSMANMERKLITSDCSNLTFLLSEKMRSHACPR